MEAQVSLTVAFSSSALLGLVSLIFLLTIPHRFSMGFRSGEFAGQSSTVTPCSLNQLCMGPSVFAIIQLFCIIQYNSILVCRRTHFCEYEIHL